MRKESRLVWPDPLLHMAFIACSVSARIRPLKLVCRSPDSYRAGPYRFHYKPCAGGKRVCRVTTDYTQFTLTLAAAIVD